MAGDGSHGAVACPSRHLPASTSHSTASTSTRCGCSNHLPYDLLRKAPLQQTPGTWCTLSLSLSRQVTSDDIMDAFEEAGTTVDTLQTPAHVVCVCGCTSPRPAACLLPRVLTWGAF